MRLVRVLRGLGSCLGLVVISGCSRGQDQAPGAAPAGSGSASQRAAAERVGPIRIGASVPLSGPVAPFGNFIKWGYEHAVANVNATGGLDVGGQKRKVELVLLDDKTDPNQASSNVDRLVLKEKVHGLLGSCTPAIVNAAAIVAERSRVPMVTGCNPLEAFKSVKGEQKWQYVWDLFFSEVDLAAAPFKSLTAAGIQTNKKVAILHDNGPDGMIVGGQLWPKFAAENGFTVVYKADFPVESAEFGSLIENAKSSGAEVLLVDAITPQAVSLRKQMKEHGYLPKVLIMEKGGEPVQFAQALGPLAEGVLVAGYWDPSFKFPGASELRTTFEKETGQSYSQHIADGLAAAEVLLDAIARAQSTDPAKVNEAIGKTDKTYVVGPIKFDAYHTSTLPIVELQWKGGKTQVVWPKESATGQLLFPLP